MKQTLFKMRKITKGLKKFGKVLVILILIGIIFLALSIPYGKSAENTIPAVGVKTSKTVIKGVHIISMETEEVVYNQNVYIEKGIIREITSDSLPVLNGFDLIEAEGKFLMPGLIDMHAHIFDRTDLPQYLSYGVTTVRNMMGFPMHLRWKQQLQITRFKEVF